MGKILIVAGLSGAGKTQALKILEDMGYYCIDNLPVEIVDKFTSLIFNENINKTAIGIDIRQENDFDKLKDILDIWKKDKQEYKILFLEASENTLVSRYKATKRKHPLENECNLIDAIKIEKEKTSWIRNIADFIINTDKHTNYNLKENIEEEIGVKEENQKFDIEVVSFGYKNGIQNDVDLLYDVRFLKNPFYEDSLRSKTGLDEDVARYIETDENLNIFIDKLMDTLDFLIPLYKKEGKNKLVIAFACTGGRHRSVYIANRVSKELEKNNNYKVILENRDIK